MLEPLEEREVSSYAAGTEREFLACVRSHFSVTASATIIVDRHYSHFDSDVGAGTEAKAAVISPLLLGVGSDSDSLT